MKERQMSVVERNKKTVMRYFEEIGGQRKVEVIDEIFSPNFLNHGPGGDIRGPEQIHKLLGLIWEKCSESGAQVDDMFGENDRVAVRVTLSGTIGSSKDIGMAALDDLVVGQRWEVYELQTYRLVDDMIVERWFALGQIKAV